jgi:hypothetical protein
MKFVCAQPADKFYTWQIEVMCRNFAKNGIDPRDQVILVGIKDGQIPKDWIKLKQGFPLVNFYFYENDREAKHYAPSIYFHLLKKHFEASDQLHNQVLFLHDCDMVFIKPPHLHKYEPGRSWYLSDTNSYLNYDYIQTKGDDLYLTMCKVIGIDPVIPKIMNSNSGGAQYIVKNTDAKFWAKVEADSVALFDLFIYKESDYVMKHDHDYPIQKWTAGMWSILWNAWKGGHETKVDQGLDFAWPTYRSDAIDNYSIFHNAGVINGSQGMFYKNDFWEKLPYFADINVDQDKASAFYWSEIQDTAKNSVLI